MIRRSVFKIINEEASSIIIIPWWSTQNRHPLVIQGLVDFLIKILSLKTTLCLPTDKTKVHSLFPKLQVITVLLSLKPSDQQSLQRNSETSSSIYEGVLQKKRLSRIKSRSYCYRYDQCTVIFIWYLWRRIFVQ